MPPSRRVDAAHASHCPRRTARTSRRKNVSVWTPATFGSRRSSRRRGRGSTRSSGRGIAMRPARRRGSHESRGWARTYGYGGAFQGRGQRDSAHASQGRSVPGAVKTGSSGERTHRPNRARTATIGTPGTGPYVFLGFGLPFTRFFSSRTKRTSTLAGVTRVPH